MATTKTTAAQKTATAKKAAPAPAPKKTEPQAGVQHKAAGAAEANGPTVNGVQLPTPNGPRYRCNLEHPAWNKVGVGSHRAYAQQTAKVLTDEMKEGFALNQLRAALAGNVLPENHPQRNVAAPTHGWMKHNMPTWGAGQAWWTVVE